MAEALFGAVQAATATLSAIKTIRKIYMGIQGVNQEVKDVFMDIEALNSAIESVYNCLADPALTRANENGLAQGSSLFAPLTSCFWSCNHTVDRLRDTMSSFNDKEERLPKRVWKFAKFKNKSENLLAIRQQLGTQLASLNTSFSALQL